MRVNRCDYHRLCLGVCKKNICTKCKECGNSPDYFPHWTVCWLKWSSTPLRWAYTCMHCSHYPLVLIPPHPAAYRDVYYRLPAHEWKATFSVAWTTSIYQLRNYNWVYLPLLGCQQTSQTRLPDESCGSVCVSIMPTPAKYSTSSHLFTDAIIKGAILPNGVLHSVGCEPSMLSIYTPSQYSLLQFCDCFLKILIFKPYWFFKLCCTELSSFLPPHCYLGWIGLYLYHCAGCLDEWISYLQTQAQTGCPVQLQFPLMFRHTRLKGQKVLVKEFLHRKPNHCTTSSNTNW